MENRQAPIEAIDALVFDARAQRYYKSMMEVTKIPEELYVGLVYPATVVSPVLQLLREDPQGFDNVMELVDSKRKDRGWEPLTPDKPQGFDRNEYQREFMRNKRDRERRAVEIENYLRHARDKLIGSARLEFMRRVGNTWKKRRDQLLEDARAAHGGTLSQEQVRTILAKFWQQIDVELDLQQEDAERKLRGF